MNPQEPTVVRGDMAIFIGISEIVPVGSVLFLLLEKASKDLPHEQESLFDF
jgi:hypothetical protein